MDLIEVKLLTNENVIKETLQRIGIADKKHKVLYPSCYLHKIEDQYFICHFKELFLLLKENGYNNFSEEDKIRRNAIIYCLKNWGLIEIEDETLIENHDVFVFVLPHSDKKNWNINHKINLNYYKFYNK